MQIFFTWCPATLQSRNFGRLAAPSALIIGPMRANHLVALAWLALASTGCMRLHARAEPISATARRFPSRRPG